MKLNIQLFGSSVFYTANRVALRLFELLSLWILIKLLPAQDIGLVGISVGFISILTFLNICPYRRVFKNFEEVAKRLSTHVSAYIIFWFALSMVMFLATVLVSLFYLPTGFSLRFFVVLAGMVTAFLFNNLQLLLQEIFFVNLKQKNITYFNVASMAVFLASMALLFLYPSVELFIILVVLKAFLTAMGCFFFAKKELGLVFHFPPDIVAVLKDALVEFAIFDHLIGATIEVFNKVFLFVLGFFAFDVVVGNYTTALSLVNLLAFFPLILYRTTMLAVTRVSTQKGLQKVLSAFAKYALVFSALQFVAFVLVLGFLVRFFSPAHFEFVWWYALLLGTGITIANIGLPWHALALLKADLKQYFLRVILPPGVLAVLGYILISAWLNPVFIGVLFVCLTAFMNWSIYRFVKKKLGLSVSLAWVLPEEREILASILQRIGLSKK